MKYGKINKCVEQENMFFRERLNMTDYELAEFDAVSLDKMCSDSVELIKYARSTAVRQVNVVQTMTNYCIGKWIVEEQQKGYKRAEYGILRLRNPIKFLGFWMKNVLFNCHGHIMSN